MVHFGEIACLDAVKNPDAPAAKRPIEGSHDAPILHQ
jgi:hypothetical protein